MCHTGNTYNSFDFLITITSIVIKIICYQKLIIQSHHKSLVLAIPVRYGLTTSGGCVGTCPQIVTVISFCSNAKQRLWSKLEYSRRYFRQLPGIPARRAWERKRPPRNPRGVRFAFATGNCNSYTVSADSLLHTLSNYRQFYFGGISLFV